MRNQKEEFFELIYAQYAKKLERICLRYVNYQPEYREIAADSVQKTFLKALEEYDKLKDASYIEPWLYQTCMHRFTTALKTYRRRMKHHVLIDEKMENVLSTERTITTIDALYYSFSKHIQKTRECVIMKTVMRNETFSNNRSGI